MSALFGRAGTRHVLRVRMKARTGLHVGCGRDHSELSTDLPLLRTGGTPFIPGSSWKGVIRSNAEALLRGLAPVAEVDSWACDPIGASCLTDGDSADDSDTDDQLPKRVADRRSQIEARVCKACATFGGMGLASHVRFSDSTIDDAAPVVRDGVGMDRDLGRASDGLKYDYEVVASGATLMLTVHMEALEDWQVGLVLASVDDLDSGHLRIGGFGTRGLGWVEQAGVELVEQSLAQRLKRESGSPIPRDRFDQALAGLVEA